jgi:hypothetical protein
MPTLAMGTIKAHACIIKLTAFGKRCDLGLGAEPNPLININDPLFGHRCPKHQRRRTGEMDSRAMKLSELPTITANNITEADLIYLVQNGVSYAVNVAALAEYILSLEGNN